MPRVPPSPSATGRGRGADPWGALERLLEAGTPAARSPASAFMGGDAAPGEVAALARHIARMHGGTIRAGWYSGAAGAAAGVRPARVRLCQARSLPGEARRPEPPDDGTNGCTGSSGPAAIPTGTAAPRHGPFSERRSGRSPRRVPLPNDGHHLPRLLASLSAGTNGSGTRGCVKTHFSRKWGFGLKPATSLKRKRRVVSSSVPSNDTDSSLFRSYNLQLWRERSFQF